MLCKKCGKEIIVESIFCNFCGDKVLNIEETTEIQSFENENRNVVTLEENKPELESIVEYEQEKIPSISEVNSPELSEVNSPKIFSNIESKELAKKTSIKTNTKKVIVSTSIVLTCIFFIVGYYFLIPYLKYNEATSAMKNQVYEKAIASFTDLKNFKNSPEMLLESKYLYANQMMSENKFENAIKLFQEVSSYKDSNQLEVKSKYLLGKSLMTDAKFNSALNLFMEIQNYEDSAQLTLEAKYQIGKQLMSKKDFSASRDIFKEIKDYNDVGSLLSEVTYLQGTKEYNNGNLNESIALFSEIQDYKDSKEYIENISTLKKFEGTWESKYAFSQIIFSGNKVTNVYFPNSHDTKVYTFDVSPHSGVLIQSKYIYSLYNNKLIVNNSNGEKEEYTKIGNTTSIPKEKPVPAIGMTANDVINSNWGRPQKINKTTYAGGVREQWVYANFKYIYLENGIVTAIQE